MNRTTATVLGLREKLAEERALTERLRNNISGLCHETARLEMAADKALRLLDEGGDNSALYARAALRYALQNAPKL